MSDLTCDLVVIGAGPGGYVAAIRAAQLGRKVLVIGGGNVAMDVAMTAIRQGAEKVSLVALEQRGEMPAWEVPNMIAKYCTTIRALELARQR